MKADCLSAAHDHGTERGAAVYRKQGPAPPSGHRYCPPAPAPTDYPPGGHSGVQRAHAATPPLLPPHPHPPPPPITRPAAAAEFKGLTQQHHRLQRTHVSFPHAFFLKARGGGLSVGPNALKVNTKGPRLYNNAAALCLLDPMPLVSFSLLWVLSHRYLIVHGSSRRVAALRERSAMDQPPMCFLHRFCPASTPRTCQREPQVCPSTSSTGRWGHRMLVRLQRIRCGDIRPHVGGGQWKAYVVLCCL